MESKNRVIPIVMTSFDTAGLDGTYKVVNTSGLEEACYVLRIINDSDIDVIVSYDGVNANDYVQAGETLQVYSQVYERNHTNFAKGTKVYVTGAGAGTGLVYLSGYHQPISR